MSVPPHEVLHTPALQTSPVLQVVLHAPQFVGSVVRSLQAPEHTVVPAEHVSWHLPVSHS